MYVFELVDTLRVQQFRWYLAHMDASAKSRKAVYLFVMPVALWVEVAGYIVHNAYKLGNWNRKITHDRRFAFRLLILSIPLIVVVALAEVGIRLFLADQIVMFPRYHSEAQYGDFTVRRFRPNTVFWHTSVDGRWRFDINTQGFRNHRDFGYEKANGTTRIVVLGDSHMAGFEVRQEQTLSATLERYLNGQGVRAEVINTGVSGFSTAEELVVLENEALKYDPDFVILALSSNDFEDNIKSGIFALDGDELIVKKYTHIPGVRILNLLNKFSVIRWLSENSYLYSVGLNTAWRMGKRMLTSRTRAELTTEYALSTRDADDYEKELLARLVERIFRLCRERDIGLITIDIPRPSPVGEVRSSIPSELRARLRASSSAYLDSNETFEEYKDLAKLHVPHGARHISEFTHQVLSLETGRRILGLRGHGSQESGFKAAVELPREN